MSASSLFRDWRRQVQLELLPDLHGHQSKALADLRCARTVVNHGHSGKLAVAVPGDARPARLPRRRGRLLANDRRDPDSAWPQLARGVLGGAVGGPVVLILDGTPDPNDLRGLKITPADRQRAPPRCGACDRRGAPPEPRPELLVGLCRAGAACLPAGAEVPLRADRGLARPSVVDACGEPGGHSRLRLQGQTRGRTADGRECAAADLAPRPGPRWWGDAEVVTKSGWRGAHVAAGWERDCDGPWRLVRDRPDGRGLIRRSARRVWTEEWFPDEKSSGSHWDQSQVTDPAHAARLVLLRARATSLALGLGSRVIQAGRRRVLEPGRQRRLSLFQIGLRWVMSCVTQDRPLPKELSPVPL
jgi:hypothetical protein